MPLRLSCSICSEEVFHSESVAALPCGHVFHYPCLVEWLERAQTCPLCRKKGRLGSAIQLFFDTDETVVGDADTVNPVQVESLKFQLKLTIQEKEVLQKENSSLVSQLSGILESNGKLEEESKSLKKKNASLKSKLNELQRVELAFRSQARELANAKKELEECQKLKNLMGAGTVEFEEAMSSYNNPPPAIRDLILLNIYYRNMINDMTVKMNGMKARLSRGKAQRPSSCNEALLLKVKGLEKAKEELERKLWKMKKTEVECSNEREESESEFQFPSKIGMFSKALPSTSDNPPNRKRKIRDISNGTVTHGSISISPIFKRSLSSTSQRL